MKSFKEFFFENVDINNLTLKTNSEKAPIGGYNEHVRLFDNDKEIAHIKTIVQSEYVNILALYVQQLYREKGLAKRLLKYVIDKYPEKDVYIRPYAYKDQPMSDKQLEQFYKKMGFEQDVNRPKGHLIKYYHK